MTSALTRMAALLLLVPAIASAQAKPNLSGTWHPISPAIASAVQDITIKQDATTITITPPGDGKTSHVYRLDGTESREGTQSTKVSWQGDTLAITTTFGRYHSTTRHSLDAAGNLVTEVNDPPPLGSGTLVRVVYKKR